MNAKMGGIKMALNKTKVSTKKQTRTSTDGLAAKPVSRIQTAEGWRRSQLRKRKMAKTKAK